MVEKKFPKVIHFNSEMEFRAAFRESAEVYPDLEKGLECFHRITIMRDAVTGRVTVTQNEPDRTRAKRVQAVDQWGEPKR